MDLDLVRILVTVVAVLLLFGLAGVIWLTAIIALGDRRSRGLRYFGQPPADRERYRQRLRFHARMLAPVIRALARSSPFSFDKASFDHNGVTGPRGTCTPQSFRAGTTYQPRPSDIFVVTQMRSGTTWMQQLVYEILMRGEGNLVDSGRTLNAVSPFLESVIGVPADDAPAIGIDRPSQLIKTHFPASLCPWSAHSRYIYVVRHPVSCFASCVDFLAENLGPSMPAIADIEAWFCSERMWWGSWPRHVEGWRARSAEQANVLFVHFEAMATNLPAVAAEVAAFLGVPPLDEKEMRAVTTKAGFDYMKRHSNAFEMYPPHLLAVDSVYFARGTADRHRDVSGDTRDRVMRWCRDQLAGGAVVLDHFYPDDGGAASPRTGDSIAPGPTVR